MRRLDARQWAGTAAMTDAPEPVAHETRAGPEPAVIHLPDLTARAVPKKPKRKRGHVDHFRTDDEEHAELAARAGAAGLSVDAYCRMKTLGDPGPRSRRSPPTEDSRLKAQHIIAINRAGNLANQGIRALNEIALTAPAATSRDRLADEVMPRGNCCSAAIAALSHWRWCRGSGDDRQGQHHSDGVKLAHYLMKGGPGERAELLDMRGLGVHGDLSELSASNAELAKAPRPKSRFFMCR